MLRTSELRTLHQRAVPRRAGVWPVGNWHATEWLGHGRWSQVVRARPAHAPSTERGDYALKFPRADADSGLARQLLDREAVVGRSVQHPHLMTVLAVETEGELPRLVMPYLAGASLRSALTMVGPLPFVHALWIARQVAEALRALHLAGWLHADVNPSNILVAPTGHVTLIDLGFCLQRETLECRRPQALRGTLPYVAPEMVVHSAELDAASDVYGLGATLFETLTGAVPFDEPDLPRMALAHVRRAVPDPRSRTPQLPTSVGQLVRQMLAKEPLRRPSVDELLTRFVALEIEFLRERGASLVA